MKSIFLLTSVVLGIIPQLMVIWGIHKNTMKLSFSTYFVWFLLNLVIATASIAERGNYGLSLAYVVLNITIAIMILRKEKKATFPPWEQIIILLSIICIIIWSLTDGAYAVIAASVSSFIAGISQLVVVYKNPKLTSPIVWLFGTLAPLFSVFAGKDWSVVERFYPMTFFVYGVIGLCVLFIAKLNTTTPQNKSASSSVI